ncbi:MAG: hypothetical protein EZS28_028904 [Streblomastix strix]|uniref:Uncharacterized protein n=1 Tax=Streblomastix strix TaxID=222440 RepID=A0A5J4UYJ0_9EUKA|nr:MAG: hypothetical protein EZS28_028904 [Streblomastix strix]
MDHDKQHIFFDDTHVVRAHDTTSGSSNDVPLPQFKLYEDSFKFIRMPALIQLLDFIIIVIMQALFGIDTWEIIFRADIQQQSLFLQIYKQI